MSSTVFVFEVAMLMSFCLAQDYAFIDDIPIESYDHGDHQENDMDLELLPVRRGRSSSSDEDPKDYFFRSMRSFDDFDDVRTLGPYQNIPRPPLQSQAQERQKRSAPATPLLSPKREDSLNGVIKNLGKPLEVVSLDTRNLTQKDDEAESRLATDEVAINDFIRFRRAANVEESGGKESSGQQKKVPLSQKLMMEASDEDMNREARGAIKEEWVKQVYPVRKEDEMSFEDNIPSSSEHLRVPRVHFVTQKFTDNRLASSDMRPYDREPRSRRIDRLPVRDPPRDLARDIEEDNPHFERSYRSYGQPMERGRAFYRDEYPRYDQRDYREYQRPRYQNYERSRNDFGSLMQKPQKRIIYYATLPEISRSPPNVDLRDRYRYERDRYDDRYVQDPYRFRKSYPPKARYEDEGKTPYPVKVLTDVNVREVKKSPERRIYSEVDRNRYAYNTPPYQAADG
ncbi:hypothetical protein HUJ04_012616 [Dendroctonus ponderosae]|uniref:Uncharacterized protein n=1 Tax=Dendroctonus ponderosae TaxID=77166 RepID=A0AAR5PWM7_DENPD|nr:hypothetical protein HUJ04_012616 [Dendroctonus ponderosae]KAH1023412.1 hypothetical protein HUJ04_012616 [Dendroctonus ponderosae]